MIISSCHQFWTRMVRGKGLLIMMDANAVDRADFGRPAEGRPEPAAVKPAPVEADRIDPDRAGPPGAEPAGADGQAAAALQDLLVEHSDVVEFLHELARLSAEAFSCRGTVYCGVTLQRTVAAEYTVASSGDTARALDEVQYDFGDGPCLHALRTGGEVLVADTTWEGRWRNYTAHIRTLGVRSVYSLPLALEGRAKAALNLYAEEPGVFDHQFQSAARSYAAQASQALKLAVRLAAQVGTVTDLQAVLASRTDIDLAVGIIMGQNRCGQQEAFDVLRRASNARNLKLRAVAAEVVERYNGAPAQTHFGNA